MSILSKIQGLFGNARPSPTDLNEQINESALSIVSILAESLGNKGRAKSPEMLIALGTLTGQLVLRGKLGDRIHSVKSNDNVLLEGVSDRVFKLHSILKHNCENEYLKEALIEGIKLPEIEPAFIADIIKECLPKIEGVFSEMHLPKENQDLAGAMAILVAIQNVKEEFNEDISGTLPYVTHAIVAGSHIVIR